ncbi:MAG TPA: hypothetical protein VHQ01_09505 [Pyrinomonadaceae bacterium]|jgi:hypothetical protein|nr:hypothetical protein [Pyrinomonadaceae bacterium]
MSEKRDDTTVWLSPLVFYQGFGVQFRDDHVHVELSKDFKIDPEHRNALWNVIGETCEKHGSRRVLVEGFLPPGERETADVIDAGQKTATVPNLWLAFHISNFQRTAATELYEVIAASRGVRVKFFTDRERALNWLRQNTPA